jgi:hypothetical protein
MARKKRLTAAELASAWAAQSLRPRWSWYGKKRPPAKPQGAKPVFARLKGALYILPAFRGKYMEHPKVKGMLIRRPGR